MMSNAMFYCIVILLGTNVVICSIVSIGDNAFSCRHCKNNRCTCRPVARILAWGFVIGVGTSEEARGLKGRNKSGYRVLGEGAASPLPTN